MENLTISAHQDKKKAETEQEQAETLQLTNRKKLNKFSKHATFATNTTVQHTSTKEHSQRLG